MTDRELRSFGGDHSGAHVKLPLSCPNPERVVLGTRSFVNSGCYLHAFGADIVIGDYARLGPGVHVYTVSHPTDHRLRRSRATRNVYLPVSIGADAWIGGGAVVLPGVSIGARAIVGAGSVVTRDVPEDELWAGNPARFIRRAG